MRRKSFAIISIGLALGCLAIAQNRPAILDEMGYADTVIMNGKIVSMDDHSITPDTPGHIYQAMAIKGEKIMALGTDAEMKALAGPKTKTVDLGGKTMIPGLIQPHYHIFGPAAALYGPSNGLSDPSVKLSVTAEKTSEATAKKLRDTIVNAIAVQKLPKGQWITVDLQEGKENRRGTTFTWLYLGQLNHRQIDKGTENNPVLVRTGLQGTFNSTAIAEIKKVFPDWEQSTDLENGPGRGRDGYAAVPELQGLALEYWWKDKPLSAYAEAMRMAGLDAQRAGYTTIGTRILFPRVIASFHLLNREGKMPHRLAYYIESQRGNFFDLKATREFYKGMGAPWTTHAAGNSMVWLNGMTNEVWDSIYNEVCLGPDMPSATAEMKARERCPGPGSKPWESVKAGIVTGWRPIEVHATSSHGARLYLKMMEESMKEGGYSVEYMKNLRTSLEHNILVGTPPDVMEGLRKFGVILNVNTGMLADVPENIKDYGPGLEKFAMPVKTWMYKEGIKVTFEAAGLNPWVNIYTLVTRHIPVKGKEDVVLLPNEGIDRVTALKMQTTWAADYVMAEDTLGSFTPGKYADFAVLEKDFFTIPIEELRTPLKIAMTGLAGKIVYDASKVPAKP